MGIVELSKASDREAGKADADPASPDTAPPSITAVASNFVCILIMHVSNSGLITSVNIKRSRAGWVPLFWQGQYAPQSSLRHADRQPVIHFGGTYRPLFSYFDESNPNLSPVMPKTSPKLLATSVLATALFALSNPALAVTCEEARSLTREQLDYWARRLEVTSPYLSELLDQAFCKRRIESSDAWAMAECNVTRQPNEGRKSWGRMSSRCAMRHPK
ncbi:MAG TPA: hypothetical protein VK148_15470 [Xanthobacteraceae bacterium]|nr:hypothetical protein [Xanthobacteraceae bacterium]